MKLFGKSGGALLAVQVKASAVIDPQALKTTLFKGRGQGRRRRAGNLHQVVLHLRSCEDLLHGAKDHCRNCCGFCQFLCQGRQNLSCETVFHGQNVLLRSAFVWRSGRSARGLAVARVDISGCWLLVAVSLQPVATRSIRGSHPFSQGFQRTPKAC